MKQRLSVALFLYSVLCITTSLHAQSTDYIGSKQVLFIPSGHSGYPDFSVDSQIWIDQSIYDQPFDHPKPIIIHNLSKDTSIQITSAVIADTLHFKLLTSLPILVRASDTAQAWFIFTPSDIAKVTSTVMWTSPDVLNQFNQPELRISRLTGNAAFIDIVATQASIDDTGARLYSDGTLLHASLPFDWPKAELQIKNILGMAILTVPIDAASKIDTRMLPHGVYFYQLSNDGAMVTGKILL